MQRIKKFVDWIRADWLRAVYILVGIWVGFQIYFFVQIAWWVHHNPTSTSFMLRQERALKAKNPKAKISHRWISYKKMSPNLKRAALAGEDDKFRQHWGVDWPAIWVAFKKNIKKGKIVSGGSTITQQLAKNLFLSGSRSFIRKGQEAIIAYMLEFWMSKARILEIYLNVVEFGVGVFGVDAAARHYYGVSASSLSPAQAARLIAMLPKPRYFDKHRGSGYLAHRTNLILNRMYIVRAPRK